jgi:chemotaxis protein MotB
MLKFNYLLLLAGSSLFISSCKPIYQCGDNIPQKEVAGGKRIKAVVAERDQLCENLKTQENENAGLKIKVSDLELGKQNLEDKYSNLFKANISQADQYTEALRMKSDELKEKERILSEREKALREMKAVIARQDSITQRLNDVLRNALLGFNSDELSVEIRDGKVYVSMSDKLLFKSGSANVEDKGKQAMKVLADVLGKNPDINILVEGHTDNVPIKTAIYKDNWDLSVGRATSIVRLLTDEYKLVPTRVTASGKGEFSPKANNETTEGRAKNRRTEIILTPKLDEIMQLLNAK